MSNKLTTPSATVVPDKGKLVALFMDYLQGAGKKTPLPEKQLLKQDLGTLKNAFSRSIKDEYTRRRTIIRTRRKKAEQKYSEALQEIDRLKEDEAKLEQEFLTSIDLPLGGRIDINKDAKVKEVAIEEIENTETDDDPENEIIEPPEPARDSQPELVDTVGPKAGFKLKIQETEKVEDGEIKITPKSDWEPSPAAQPSHVVTMNDLQPPPAASKPSKGFKLSFGKKEPQEQQGNKLVVVGKNKTDLDTLNDRKHASLDNNDRQVGRKPVLLDKLEERLVAKS